MELIDFAFIASYFLISCSFIILIMSEEISRLPQKLKTCLLQKRTGKEPSERIAVRKNLHRPETLIERREKALDYLVKNYFEVKKREEEHKKKMESYGTIRGWVYERSMNLKNILTFMTRTIVKPSIMLLMTYSTALSLYLGMRVGPQIAQLTGRYIPHPFNYIFDVFIIFPIGFSPGILSVVLNYHLEKKTLNRILKEYGLRI